MRHLVLKNLKNGPIDFGLIKSKRYSRFHSSFFLQYKSVHLFPLFILATMNIFVRKSVYVQICVCCPNTDKDVCVNAGEDVCVNARV